MERDSIPLDMPSMQGEFTFLERRRTLYKIKIFHHHDRPVTRFTPGYGILPIAILCLIQCFVCAAPNSKAERKNGIGNAQAPTWSTDDLQFFLHGSMGTEVVPEAVLRAFIRIYPDLFPTADLTNLGLIPDNEFGWPIGFSRRQVKHLGNLPAVGINCASCHVAEINTGDQDLRVLGTTSHFDVEGFFGSVLVATFRTSDPANMKRFVLAYLAEIDPELAKDAKKTAVYEYEWDQEKEKISSAISADPFGSKDIGAGELHAISPNDLKVNIETPDPFVALSETMLKLFHNMRAALHVPDQPPDKPPPASGPGRNDAFGLLSAALLNSPQPYAPIKFGLVWNVDKRRWVHWDGNTQSPLARNLLASLGLGAPSQGRKADLDFALVKRQTDLTEKIRPPRYPFKIDEAAAKRGASYFESKCDSCHGGPESDRRLYSVAEIKTDPKRAESFNERQAGKFNKYLAELEFAGYEPPKELGVRSTGKYFAPTLSGVWARSPYLHNGSIRTMEQLLASPAERAKTFHRGSKTFDEVTMGYADEGSYLFDTSGSGNSNSGHDYATNLSAADKRDLIEYLKTL
jgi:hypothetical protein